MKTRRLMLVVSALVLLLSPFTATAETTTSTKCPPCPECPSCEEEIDLSDWRITSTLGFNLTRGNSDTLLLTNNNKAERDINKHIYLFTVDGSFGNDKNVEDQENGSTTQKQVKAAGSYKHLLGDRLFSAVTGSAFFDQIADVDYRYIGGIGLGYFLIKNDTLKFSLEAGPAYVFEKLGGEKDDYPSARFAEHLKWSISSSSRFFHNFELLCNLEDSDDTLITAEAGIEAAINSSLALTLSIKDVYDNLPAEGTERNDLTITSGIQFTL